jgi:hypothetical protein
MAGVVKQEVMLIERGLGGVAHAGGISGAEVPRRGSGGWQYVFSHRDLSTDPRLWCKRSATAILRHH